MLEITTVHKPCVARGRGLVCTLTHAVSGALRCCACTWRHMCEVYVAIPLQIVLRMKIFLKVCLEDVRSQLVLPRQSLGWFCCARLFLMLVVQDARWAALTAIMLHLLE